MKMDSTNNAIVASGGYVVMKRRCRPRTRLFTMLSMLWVFPSLGAVVIIGADFRRWFHARTLLSSLQAVAFEQWVALGLLFLQVLFVVLALHFAQRETSKEAEVWLPYPWNQSFKFPKPASPPQAVAKTIRLPQADDPT